MSARTRAVLLGVALVALAVWAMSAWLGRPSPASREPSLEVEDAALALRWRAGSSQRYRLRVDSSIRSLTGAAGSSQSATVRVDAHLELRTLEVSAAGALAGMRLSPVEMTISGASDQETNRALSLPFRVRFARNGMPEAFEFPEAASSEHRGMIENLVRGFQVTLEPGETWLARETHLTGTYEATYTRSAPTSVEKKKLRYVDSSPETTGNVPLISSRESIRLEAGRDWIAEMTVDETVRNEDPTGVSFEITNHASLELVPESVAGSAPDAWSFVAASAPATPDRAEQLKARLNLSHEKAEEQLRAALLALDGGAEGRSRWIHLIRDLLLVDDELPAALLDAMRTQELGDQTRADLYLAFELAGSPHSQAALASVIRDPSWTEMDGLRAIVALGAVSNPSPETIEALRETAQGGGRGDSRDLVSTAILALGSIGRSLQDREDASYSELREELLAGALGATDPGRRASFALALGNTADPALSGEIAPLLDDGDARVRSAAARSLGKLGPNDVADDLMRRLAQEKSGVVRASIAEALEAWESPSPAAMESIRRTIGNEPDESARFSMARMLANTLAATPENEIALDELLRAEQSKRIRQHIAEALARSRGK